MKIHEMIAYLSQFPETATVRLWNWFPLPGTGAEFDLHFTANKGGDVIRMSAEGGRDWSTGPQKQTYLRVEQNNLDIVGSQFMTSEEAAVANSWVMYYGDEFMTPEEWVRVAERYGKQLPDEYREEEGGEENE